MSRVLFLLNLEKKLSMAIKYLIHKTPLVKVTWFAANDNAGISVLLNGAFEKHRIKKSHATSRRLILLNVISTANPVDTLRKIDLKNIEPFTGVLLAQNRLFEFRWNKEKKFLEELEINESYIGSSVTLYTKEIRFLRENLCTKFFTRKPNGDNVDILDFHLGDTSDVENGFVINRKTGLKTFSITEAVIHKDFLTPSHRNLNSNQVYSNSVS